MSKPIDEIKAALADIGNDVTEIDGDLQEVLDKLNDLSGAPTAAELDEVKTLVVALKSRTRAAADKVPEP